MFLGIQQTWVGAIDVYASKTLFYSIIISPESGIGFNSNKIFERNILFQRLTHLKLSWSYVVTICNFVSMDSAYFNFVEVTHCLI